MKIIGLTGGIASGKSTVAGFLRELGAVTIDADKVGHEAFVPDTDTWREVVNAFGDEIVTPGGEIDRRKLGGIVFGDEQARIRLNRIVHPRISALIRDRLEEYRRQGVGVAVVEAALLLEMERPSLADEADEVWVTVAPEEVVVGRLKEKNGFSDEQSLARIRSQLSNEERLKRADVVIDTDCSIEELRERVTELWRRLLA